MTSNQQVHAIDMSQPRAAGMLAGVVIAAVIGAALLSNATATARQANPLAGNGEVMRAPLAAPGAVQVAGDPSLPDAADALRLLPADRARTVDAPTF